MGSQGATVWVSQAHLVSAGNHLAMECLMALNSGSRDHPACTMVEGIPNLPKAPLNHLLNSTHDYHREKHTHTHIYTYIHNIT